MKQLKYKITNLCLLVLIMLMSMPANAQVDSLRLTLDNIFAHVDKSQIPGGFFEEYGAQFANLKTYNGVLRDSNTVNAMAWHYVYASVYSAKIYGANMLPTPDNNYTVFNSEAILNAGANPVKVFALSYVKPDAVMNNLLALFYNPKTDANTNHIDICHCIRNTIFTITTLPPRSFQFSN